MISDLEVLDAITRQACDDGLLCGWATLEYLKNFSKIDENRYLWCVGGSGRLTTIEVVGTHPSVPDVVMYREIR